MVPGLALMSHGMITREDDGTSAGWCLLVGWAGAIVAIFLAVLMCSAGCRCWKNCDKKHKQRGGEKAEARFPFVTQLIY